MAGWAVAGILLWQTELPELDLPRVELSAYFSASQLARAADFRAVTRPLWAASTALELGVVGLLAWRARPIARRLGRARMRTGLALGLLVVGSAWLAVLPPAGVGHWWRRRYGLSEQGYPAWLGDELIALTVRAALVSLAVAGALALAARLGSRWWVAGGPLLGGLGLLFVLAQPLVIQPLFNRFEPLPDRALAEEIQALARSEGVRVNRVEVADASRRTTAANAYVAGIGPTRRVVLYDTLFSGGFTRDEILSVSAHELAHVGRRHLWKGAAWFALLAVPGLWVLVRVTERRGGLRDPALVPLGLLVALVLNLATLPLQNVLSRRYEAEADWVAVRATRDPAGAVGLVRRLALAGLGDPDPPGWVTVWLSTHPSTKERIAVALAYEASAGPSP